MAKVIATISLKGGVGKTTVTGGLAEFMACLLYTSDAADE